MLLWLHVSYSAYFVAVALSGMFAVTFSIVFAYVADCTTESERSCSYGLVSMITLTYTHMFTTDLLVPIISTRKR